MTPDRKQMEADILQFVRSRCPQYPSDLTSETDLLEKGLLDSLLLVDLIFQVEDQYGIRLGSEQVSPSNFRTTSTIVDLVSSQMLPGNGVVSGGKSASTSTLA